MSQRDTMEKKRSEKVAAWLKRTSLCIGILALLGLGLSGCVTRGTHDQALAELGKARQAAAQQAESDEREKAELEKQLRDATNLSAKVRLERDELKTKADDLERKLETANQVLAKRAEMLDGALGRIGALTEKEQELGQTLSAAQGTIRELTIKNEAERAQTAALREDKQRL
ncbi:MAG: hypothetical protein OEV77_05640, partial [Nitrospira sp.]|nr:hypothetical protein [Nitrospira sp.]